MKLLQTFTPPPPDRLAVLAVTLVVAALAGLALPAAPALALGPNFCYDDGGRALEVPAHFHARFPGARHRAPVGPLNPDGMNCKPIPSGGTPTLCNRNGVVIAGRISGSECVTTAPSGQCYHKGQLIMAAHWNVAHPGLLETDTSIPPAHRYYDSSRDFSLGSLRRDGSGNCLPAPPGFCYGSLVEGGTTNHYLMKSVTRTGSYEPTCLTPAQSR